MVQQSWVGIIEQTLISHAIVHLFVLRILQLLHVKYEYHISAFYNSLLQPCKICLQCLHIFHHGITPRVCHLADSSGFYARAICSF